MNTLTIDGEENIVAILSIKMRKWCDGGCFSDLWNRNEVAIQLKEINRKW